MKRKTIKEILLEGAEDNCKICKKSLLDLRDDDDYNLYLDTCSDDCRRVYNGKIWPKEEDCPGCPGHINGPHKLSCYHVGAYIKIPVTLK